MNPYEPPVAPNEPPKPDQSVTHNVWMMIVITGLAPPAIWFGITMVVLTVLKMLGIT
jgi:hypothetical protein